MDGRGGERESAPAPHPIPSFPRRSTLTLFSLITSHSFGSAKPANPTPPTPAVTLPTLTPEERRAEFEKRKARAARFGLPIPVDPEEEGERAAKRAARFGFADGGGVGGGDAPAPAT